MIRLVLLGGLGNQMFQYAAAKALAMKFNTDVLIDLYGLSKDTKRGTSRNYDLEIFDLNLPTEVSLKGKICIKFRPLILKNRNLFTQFCFTDQWAIKYDERFERLKNGACLCGYFQNSNYYKAITEELKLDFKFKLPLVHRNKELAEKIKSENSVSIHIRRGDYINNTNAQSNFAVCSLKYYKGALNFIRNNVESLNLYLFSDDPEWAVEALDIRDSATIVNWNTDKNSYIDMKLMSLCKHNIIANSTFSWWGAWLNANSDKIVIAPSKWYRNDLKNEFLDEFYPSSWIKLDI